MNANAMPTAGQIIPLHANAMPTAKGAALGNFSPLGGAPTYSGCKGCHPK